MSYLFFEKSILRSPHDHPNRHWELGAREQPGIEILSSPAGQLQFNGVDVFHPNSGEIRSHGADGIACWFIDTDYCH